MVKVMPLAAWYVVPPMTNSGIELGPGLGEAAFDIVTPLTTIAEADGPKETVVPPTVIAWPGTSV